MDDDQGLRAVIEAAEQAAEAGDYALAERHLRQAVELQERALGPVHSDLANTLNNLGVACEYVGKLDDAEDAYRRAYAIALQTFDPDHPFVTRSAENLRDFCEARGRPFDLDPPPSAPIASEPPPPPPPVKLELQPHADIEVPVATPPDVRSEVSAPRSRILPIVAIAGAIALVALWGFFNRGLLAPGSPADVSHDAPAPSAESETAPVPASAPVEAVEPEPNADAVEPAGEPADSASDDIPSVPSTPPAAPALSATSAVAYANVCRRFSRTDGSDWLCDPVRDVVAPGALVFYTRVRSPRPTTIEHRWYVDGRLDQRVELNVGANPGAGFRTYSRHIITADRAGAWRVELRGSDGTVLHEQRFTVQ